MREFRAARTIAEMYGLDDLLLTTLQPNAAKLAGVLDSELADIHATLQPCPLDPCSKGRALAEPGHEPKNENTQEKFKF